MFKSKYYLPEDAITRSYQEEKKIQTFTNEVDIKTYDNAVILPLIRVTNVMRNNGRPVNYGGVSDENFNFLSGYFYKEQSIGHGDFEYTSSYNPKDIDSLSETVIFSGTLINHFGHFIEDSMSQLWYAIKNNDPKLKVALLLHASRSWDDWELESSYHLKMLNLLGIEKDRILIVDKPTKFKSVIVPKQSVFWWGNSYNSEQLKIIYDTARTNVIPKNYKRIYLTRSAWKRPILNESYFEDFFKSRDFHVIHPQELSLEELLAYIAGADEIACTYGTLSHLLLFAKQGTKFICLLRNAEFVSSRQQIVDKFRQLDSTYIDTSFNFLTPKAEIDPHLIAPTPHWKKFLNNEYGIVDESDFFEYLNTSDIKFGDYFKTYLQRLKSPGFYRAVYGLKFNPVILIKSLFKALEPDDINQALQYIKNTNHPLFKGRLFIYRRSDTGLKCTVKLLPSGNIWTVEPDRLRGEASWSYLNGRLFFLDGAMQVISEFVVEGVRIRRGHAKYKGVIQPKVSETCSLDIFEPGAWRNWIIRHTIKYLVNAKRYKKLKHSPGKFFADSKNRFIRYLGRFYVRGNSTVIFYWRKQFQEYFDAHDMKQKVYSLKQGMDDISIKYVDHFMRLSRYWFKSTFVGSQWTGHDLEKQKQSRIFAKTFEQPFPDILTVKPYYFFDIYGLADLPREALASIDGKIIIDGGGTTVTQPWSSTGTFPTQRYMSTSLWSTTWAS